MKQVFNPFLPSYEYVPDGEPHVFGERVYLYGSHDKFNGMFFCMNDYVCYSAPVNDLTNWRYEGVIWRKSDDPTKYTNLLKQMYAPDVVQGNDGRYYLYYSKGNSGIIGVAVCDTPAGQYVFHGLVRYADGSLLGRNKEKNFHQFDPGLFRDDDGKVYLYTGFAPKGANIITNFHSVNNKGAMVAELQEDMLTVKTPFNFVAKTQHCSLNTGYEKHEFFEASSMRKFNGKYYFIYSSVQGHELCYAIGDKPNGEFVYGGTLVSIGDLGISDKAMNYLGNTHGSVEYLNGKYYVFYHRQTNRHCHSRQACAEEIRMLPDGHFKQAEVTSCGLNGKALKGVGCFEARIACHLFSKKGTRFYTLKLPAGCHPYFTQTGKDREENGDQYIANFKDGATAGFKYFDFNDAQSVSVKVKGSCNGKLVVKDGVDGNVVAEIALSPCKAPTVFSADLRIENGVKPLYFTFYGQGKFDFFSFELQ